MDYVALAAELADPKYNGMADADIVTTLKAETAPGPFVDVSTSAIVGYLALEGRLFGIELLAKQTTSTTDQTKFDDGDKAIAAASTLLSIIGAVETFNASDSRKRATMFVMFGALVTAGVADASDVQALTALCSTTLTKLQSIGCPELQGMDDDSVIDHLEIARGNDPQLARRTATADEIKLMEDHAAAVLDADAPTQPMGLAATAAAAAKAATL